MDKNEVKVLRKGAGQKVGRGKSTKDFVDLGEFQISEFEIAREIDNWAGGNSKFQIFGMKNIKEKRRRRDHWVKQPDVMHN